MGALHKFYEHINFWNDLGAFSEAYTYNVRGAMTKRKSDVFEQDIFFRYRNGSISSISDKLTDGLTMTGQYTYDKAGRLTQAYMKVGGAPRYVDYTYDLNGNITSLVRDGDDGIDPIAWIDNMTYRYDGNKVRKITDTNGDVISERTMDFPDKADLDTEYAYDRNGNMTWDANRGVHMQWDANNLLSCAYYNPGVLSFTRSATGRRLSRSYSPNQSVALVGGTIKKGRSFGDFPSFGGFDRPGQSGFPIIDTYDTYGAYEYENGKFSRLNTATGYRDSLGVHVYVRDYQGNIRAVVRKGADGKTILEQATYYYPYGMPMAESTNPTANRYKYTGKELLTDHGVNILDYGPRPYDPTTGIWWSVDEHSADYAPMSHYSMCAGDPINFVDQNGKDAVRIVDEDNKTITIKANYYVVTSPQVYKQDGQISYLSGYSDKDISNMNSYNQYLNDLNLVVTSGEYEGYKISFDLCFLDGGSKIDAENLADNETYEGIKIGNTIERSNENVNPYVGFKETIDSNGNIRFVGGVTSHHKTILMNERSDNQMNRLHEIFHTFGFSDTPGGARHGIMKYPPKNPDKKDALKLSNTSFLKTLYK